MTDDGIRYDALTQDALRGVIRSVLTRAAKKGGLPGNHHFYIAFDTQADGVLLSKRLQEQYPDEMTIVLQYQFWDLQVNDERFEVQLSFNNIPERLVVPFTAIRAFFDPSVQFGLQFATSGAANDSVRAGNTMPAVIKTADEVGGVSTRPARLAEIAAERESLPSDGNKPSAEVVELDTFRKK